MNATVAIPASVRYIKNGAGGTWWATARQKGQVHAGWSGVPGPLLLAKDVAAIAELPKQQRGETQDFNALRTLLTLPSQHVWTTIEDGCLWWCTVHDELTVNPMGETATSGHFWLTCDRPWSNSSIGGRHLAVANLPGIVTQTAGFRRTVCTPRGADEILRIIQDREDPDVIAADAARRTYEDAVSGLVRRLAPQDFELLVDLLLARDGWIRIGKLGGTVEGIDVEVENAAVNEIAFVQVKSRAHQAVLDEYVDRFQKRRERYARMIFAVHTANGHLQPPADKHVQIWNRDRIAQLVVRHGLAQWIAGRL